MQALWMVWYFIGSLIAATLGLQIVKIVTAPFFTVISRIMSKPRSSSGSGQRQ